MEHRKINGIDAHNFPSDLLGHPQLAWMGDDYVEFLISRLLPGFQPQHPGAEMLGIKSEEEPSFLTSVDWQTGTIKRVTVHFNLQMLFLMSNGQHFRFRGIASFRATGLDQPDHGTFDGEFDLRSTETLN